MGKIKLINEDSSKLTGSADMIFTDPPFEMRGEDVLKIIDRYDSNHLVILLTMRQASDFLQNKEWKLSFDFVFDFKSPKKSKNRRSPNYTHCNGFYFHKNHVKSIFNRKMRKRSDVFDFNGFWPTIFYAPKERSQVCGMSKNSDAVLDILGSFEIKSVIDVFSGSGTAGIAANELDIDCTLIEKDASVCRKSYAYLKFIGAAIEKQGF